MNQSFEIHLRPVGLWEFAGWCRPADQYVRVCQLPYGSPGHDSLWRNVPPNIR